MKKILLVSACVIVCLGSLLAQEKIVTEISIPIVAWSGIPANETTVESFSE